MASISWGVGSKQVVEELLRLADQYGVKNTAYNALLPTVRRAARPLVATIKARTPKDTGKLAATTQARVFINTRGYRNSATVQGKVGWFGLGAKDPRVAQARSIEFGSKFQRKRPVLIPALRQHRDQIVFDIGDSIWNDMREAEQRLEAARRTGRLKLNGIVE